MKRIILFITVALIVVPDVFALKVAHFNEYDLSDIKYENRVVVSSEKDDFDFLSDTTMDVNQNGEVDWHEQQSFVSFAEECSLYIGNAHNRYALNNTLVWIGLTGDFDSFSVNDVQVKKTDALDNDHSDIVWPYEEVKPFIDSVVLVDIEEVIGARTASDLAVATCNPFELTLHSLASDDPLFSAYIGGFGSIKSGYNSMTPANSDLIWKPSSTAVAPEPSSLMLFSIGGLGLLLKKKQA